MSSIDYNEPFKQSLRVVAKDLLQWPTDRRELKMAWNGLMAVGKASFYALVRILILLTYPLSVFTLTYFARLDSKVTEEKRQKALEKMLAQRRGLGRAANHPASTDQSIEDRQ